MDKADEEQSEKTSTVVPGQEHLELVESLMPVTPNEEEYTDIHNEVEYTDECIEDTAMDPQGAGEKVLSDLEKWDPESDDETLSLSSSASYTTIEEDSEKNKGTEVQLDLHHYLELQRYLKLLDNNMEKSQINLNQLWEEFKQCQERIFLLKQEEEEACSELKKAEACNDNIPLIHRLQKKCKRIGEEIDLENNLNSKIKKMLTDSNNSMVSAKITRNEFLCDKQFLLEEREFPPNQAEKTQINLYIEGQKAHRAKKLKERKLHDDIEEINQEQMKIKETIGQSKESYKKANTFLKETLSKMQENDQKNKEEYNAYTKQRMETVLKLKESIEANKTLRSTKKQQIVSEIEISEEKQTDSEKTYMKITEMVKEKKEAAEKQERELKKKQQENSCQIIKRILMEEKLRKKSILKTKPPPGSSHYMKQRKHVITLLQKVNLLDAINDVDKQPLHLPKLEIKTSSSDEEDNTNLVVPEFDGLWKECDFLKKTNAPPEEQVGVENRFTKENLKKTLSKPDISCDKSSETFTTAFHGKPDIIHFKDIEIGKSYRKRTVITNVSSNVNYIRYSHVTSKMKDFVDIEFHPPGLLSPGMTCELYVTFKPLINQNMTAEVNLETKTGTFQIFLKTSIKKCQLKINTSTVDFGQTVIDEILKKCIYLQNDGALGTHYNFMSVGKNSQMRSDLLYWSCDCLQPDCREASVIEAGLYGKSKAEKKFLISMKHKLISKVAFESPSDEHDSCTSMEHEESIYSMDEEDVDISVGNESSGYIGPYSSVKLEIVWHPKLSGSLRTNYIFSFSDSSLETIPVKLIGVATEILVQVLQTSMDMKICLYDRLYQDTIILDNRQTSTFKIKFDVDRRIRNHLEILPKMGIIQSKSQFQAQLKFLPRKSLAKDAPHLFDVDTSVFEMNIKIWIANYFVDVQPNDGFGTILPLESLTLEVVFQPSTAKEYEFNIVCKTLTNSLGWTRRVEVVFLRPDALPDVNPYLSSSKEGRGCANGLRKLSKTGEIDMMDVSLEQLEFPLKCKGIGVVPPLKLSHQIINFKGTALYDKSETTVYLSKSPNSQETKDDNSRKSKYQSNTDISSFEFVIPEDVPITISPCVGSVSEDELPVQIQFSPILNEKEIKQEAVTLATAILQKEVEIKYNMYLKKLEAEKEQALKIGSKGKISKKHKAVDSISSPLTQKPKPVSQPYVESIKNDSKEYSSAIIALLRSFKPNEKMYRIPCYVAYGQCSPLNPLPYDVSETIYLEVYCTTISPSIILLSDNGKSELNFGNICVGHSIMKSLTFQNISDETINLSTSVFSTSGPFLIKNSLPPLSPNEIYSLRIAFAPSTGEEFYELLLLKSALSCVHVKVTGVGIVPNLKFSFEGSIFDMGNINAQEFYTKSFTIQNLSPINIDYNIELASITDQYSIDGEWNIKPPNTKYQPLQQNSSQQLLKPFVGIQNYNGLNVFDLVPTSGQMASGSTKEIAVTFAPDHSSKNFSDIVRIYTFGKNCVHSFQVVGQGRGSTVFFDECDRPVPAIESLSISTLPQVEDETIVITLHSMFEQDKCSIVKKELLFGSITQTMTPSQKKGGEFTFEVTSEFILKGFTIEPHKATLESGSKKTAILSWNPPSGCKPGYSIKVTLPCNLKGSDNTISPIKIHLCAVVLLNCTP